MYRYPLVSSQRTTAGFGCSQVLCLIFQKRRQRGGASENNIRQYQPQLFRRIGMGSEKEGFKGILMISFGKRDFFQEIAGN